MSSHTISRRRDTQEGDTNASHGRPIMAKGKSSQAKNGFKTFFSFFSIKQKIWNNFNTHTNLPMNLQWSSSEKEVQGGWIRGISWSLRVLGIQMKFFRGLNSCKEILDKFWRVFTQEWKCSSMKTEWEFLHKKLKFGPYKELSGKPLKGIWI